MKKLYLFFNVFLTLFIFSCRTQIIQNQVNGNVIQKELTKYGSVCACRDIAIETLLEAAHIIPVENNGNDDAVNGIPLCPTHHTAFDNFLFTINPSDKSIDVYDYYQVQAG